VRRAGVLDPAGRFGLNDHACWGYESQRERADLAAAWVAGGLALGQRALYVADAPVPELIADLAQVPERDAAIEGRALLVIESSRVYDLSAPIEAAHQLAGYADLVEEAIRDGYAGLRVAADITALVADPARRAAHVHWEQYADRYMVEQPLAPLCLFDRRRIGDEFAENEHVHPLAGPRKRPFALYASGPRESTFEGEVDSLTAEPLAAALAALPDGDDTIVLSAMRFADSHGASVLHHAVQRRRTDGHPVVLRDAPPLLVRLWSVLGYDPTMLS
jgi:DcmR-like sensory protein/STAS domain-containing protein